MQKVKQATQWNGFINGNRKRFYSRRWYRTGVRVWTLGPEDQGLTPGCTHWLCDPEKIT